MCVHLSLSSTEHYLFVLNTPEEGILDNDDEVKGCGSKSEGGT